MSADEEIEGWLAEHGDYLFGYAIKRLNGDREQSRDLVQDTLLDAWKARASFAGRSAVRTWLVGILKHKIIDHIRQQIRSRELIDKVEADPSSDWFRQDGHWQESPRAWQANPEQLSEKRYFYAVLQKCMDRLSDLQKAVFSLRELSGHESEAVCKDLGITTSNFHVLMYRSRISLRACLENHWFGKRS